MICVIWLAEKIFMRYVGNAGDVKFPYDEPRNEEENKEWASKDKIQGVPLSHVQIKIQLSAL